MRSHLVKLVEKTSGFHDVIVALLAAFTTFGVVSITNLGGIGVFIGQFLALPLMMALLAEGLFSFTLALVVMTVLLSAMFSWSVAAFFLLYIGIGGYCVAFSVWRLSKKSQPSEQIIDIGNTEKKRRKSRFVLRCKSELFLPVIAAVFAFILLLIGLLLLSFPGGIVGQSQQIINNLSSGLKDPVVDELLLKGNIAFVMPGFAIASAWFLFVINALIADLLVCLVRPETQRKLKFWNQDLPEWYCLGMAFIVLVGIFPDPLIRDLVLNILIAYSLPSLLTGIGTIHDLIGKIGRGRMVVTMTFYAIWSVFVMPICVAVMAFGILAKPLGLRRPSSPLPG